MLRKGSLIPSRPLSRATQRCPSRSSIYTAPRRGQVCSETVDFPGTDVKQSVHVP